ncbi:hypothetical protein H5J22_01765 [Cetobacterium sp. 8H]|uniref:hypothetical protein n=1 Tax=Cetobacterium sp. 8H TaxID=2759681 RepID=UPI00163C1E4E|nr:hypothetical protein [Cetobacterium sp. 8H]MBC2850185.1 hypothetical protein [Cetobacterium sp. 8H]
MGKVVVLFLILFKSLLCIENVLDIIYKPNEPLLGDGYYLTVIDFPIGTYSNTLGYFSNVEIKGAPLVYDNKLEKIIIKKEQSVLREEEVKWNKHRFEVKNIKLDGVNLSLKWSDLNKKRLDIMISNWNLKDIKKSIKIEYHYSKKIEKQILNIEIPKLNSKIYLDFDLENIVTKKQIYNKKYIIIKKIKLNDYDLGITKNDIDTLGLRLIKGKKIKLQGKDYSENVKLVFLYEKLPGVLQEMENQEYFSDTKREAYLAFEVSKPIDYNLEYKLEGDILSLVCGEEKINIIQKFVLTDGKNNVEKTILLDELYLFSNYINTNYLKEHEGQKMISNIGRSLGKYISQKIIVGKEELELEVDEMGNSDILEINLGKIKVENGDLYIMLTRADKLNFENSFEYEVVSRNNEVLENVKLNFFLKNI